MDQIDQKSKMPPRGALQRGFKLLRLAGALASSELKRPFQKQASQNKGRLKQLERIVADLGQLKGAAMKLGQILSLEAQDILPPEMLEILDRLQTQSPFMPFETIEKQLQTQLGDQFKNLKDISHTPVAAASIGQVHQARLETGQKLAIKIQYPQIQESLESDLKLLKYSMQSVATLFKREVPLEDLLQECQSILLQETNYLLEASFLEKFKTNLKEHHGFIIPEFFPHLSSKQVLTLSFENGLTIPTWIKEKQPSKERRQNLASRLLKLYTLEFLDWGLVQTDPNPGNFLVSNTQDNLILLDFGATKAYPLTFRKNYAQLIAAISTQDLVSMESCIRKMKLLDEREDPCIFTLLEDLMTRAMEPFFRNTFDFQDRLYLQDVRTLTRSLITKLRYSPPPKDLILLHRKLSGLFRILQRLEVSMPLAPYLEPFLKLAQS